MKVLESGNPAGIWSLQLKCSGHGNGNNGCGALLEVDSGDLFHTQYSFCGRVEEELVTIECPECKTWTDFNNSEKATMPSGLYHKIMDMGLSTTGQPPVKTRKRDSRSRD